MYSYILFLFIMIFSLPIYSMEQTLPPQPNTTHQVYCLLKDGIKITNEYAPSILTYMAQNHPELIALWIYKHKKQALALGLLWYIRKCYMTTAEQDECAKQIFTNYCRSANGLLQHSLHALQHTKNNMLRIQGYQQELNSAIDNLYQSWEHNNSTLQKTLLNAQKNVDFLPALDNILATFQSTDSKSKETLVLVKSERKKMQHENTKIVVEQENQIKKLNHAKNKTDNALAKAQQTTEKITKMINNTEQEVRLLTKLINSRILPSLYFNNPIHCAILPLSEKMAHHKGLYRKSHFNKPLALPFQQNQA